MRKLITLAAVTAAFTAVPAFADTTGESRAEVHASVVFAHSNSEAFAGVTVGYDFDLGKSAFLGIEMSGDKVLQRGANFFYTPAVRLGVRVGEGGRAYGLGGYALVKGRDAAVFGAGYQTKFGGRMYGKVEYRRTLTSGTDVNLAGAGLGLTF